MDREVIWSNRNDGAMIIMSHRWNANFGYILPRQAPVHNPYYFALYFMLVH
jgi:hypothetical protein